MGSDDLTTNEGLRAACEAWVKGSDRIAEKPVWSPGNVGFVEAVHAAVILDPATLAIQGVTNAVALPFVP